MTYRKKLIEVALPLEAINMESAEEDQKQERQRLFDILGRITLETDKKGNTKQVVRGLVSWDDVNDPKSKVLEVGQREIAQCLAWDRGEEPPTKPDAVREYIGKYAPPAYDPFAGGGSIPLEAQRLGLEAHASDLNPVAVLINKALIEIPPRFKDQAPVNPDDRAKKNMSSWRGAQGLAADVRFYGAWMRERAFEQIGHLYPKVKINHRDTEGTEATVIAWLWARTVKCPNPACGCQMPLVRSFQLSTKKGKEAWVEPIVENMNHGDTEGTEKNLRDLCASVVPKIRFVVKSEQGKAPDPPKTGRGATFSCLACGQPAEGKHIKAEGMAGRMGAQLMAIVAEGKNGRIYLSPTPEHEEIAKSAEPTWYPDGQIGDDRRSMFTPLYGLTHFHHLFIPRQLVALTTFSDLVGEAREKAIADAVAAGLADDDVPLAEGGTGARAYGDAIATYLSLCLGRIGDFGTTISTWNTVEVSVRNTFSRQAIPMSWDYAEANPMGRTGGGHLEGAIDRITNALDFLTLSSRSGKCEQKDAPSIGITQPAEFIISTDPPYYDNIGYADLSDFFYVWLRRSLQSIYPDLFSTLLVPKAQELVATPYRFEGSKQKAQTFFEEGLGKAFNRMHEISHSGYPLTVYYAFKQAEKEQKGKAEESVSSTGWETMLEGLIKADFSIGGTWPVRTEFSSRSVASGTNALASSIVLVCRPRPTNAAKITRRQFLTELKRQLPKALKTLQQGNVAPVDLAQASIGPGMAVFSQYAAVLENDGSPMRVRTALQLINQILDEFLTEQEGEFDGDTRWALTWFEQYQFEPGQYGDAETLSKAKNTSVQGMVDAGILEAKGGKVRLLKRSELKSDWNPNNDSRMPDWEIAQYLIHELDQKGEMGAAELLAKLGSRGEIARDLAYRLYSLCDRKGWTQEALAYNSLVISWPEITRLASDVKTLDPIQTSLL